MTTIKMAGAALAYFVIAIAAIVIIEVGRWVGFVFRALFG
jgi:hypothetical protein